MSVYYIAFDDTDNLESPGTGHILTDFLHSLPCETGFISRHQLFVNKDVPYTSHNSSMCSTVSGDIGRETLIRLAAEHLKRTLAPGADPGLCVAKADEIISPEKLVRWGYRAKREVLTKEEAYATASECGVHLSEHGGTGQGVVGALAGIGLRIGGQDGRVKGRKDVSKPCLTVQELLAETGFDRVCAYGEGALAPDAVILTGGDRIKAVYQDFCTTVLTVRDGETYRLVQKDFLRSY